MDENAKDSTTDSDALPKLDVESVMDAIYNPLENKKKTSNAMRHEQQTKLSSIACRLTSLSCRISTYMAIMVMLFCVFCLDLTNFAKRYVNLEDKEKFAFMLKHSWRTVITVIALYELTKGFGESTREYLLMRHFDQYPETLELAQADANYWKAEWKAEYKMHLAKYSLLESDLDSTRTLKESLDRQVESANNLIRIGYSMITNLCAEVRILEAAMERSQRSIDLREQCIRHIAHTSVGHVARIRALEGQICDMETLMSGSTADIEAVNERIANIGVDRSEAPA